MITSAAHTSCSSLGNTRVHLGNVQVLLHARCILAILYPWPVESHETGGSFRALLNSEAGSGAVGSVAATEPLLAERGAPEPHDA
jgi:hypothetical protein